MAGKGFFSEAAARKGRRRGGRQWRLRVLRREAAAAGAAGAEPTRLDARAALARGVARLREAGLASLGREAGLAAELLLLHVVEQTVRMMRSRTVRALPAARLTRGGAASPPLTPREKSNTGMARGGRGATGRGCTRILSMC